MSREGRDEAISGSVPANTTKMRCYTDRNGDALGAYAVSSGPIYLITSYKKAALKKITRSIQEMDIEMCISARRPK